MKTKALLLALAVGVFSSPSSYAQYPPGECTNCLLLNSWSFLNTNYWLSDAGYSPVAFSNIVSVPSVGGGNWLVLDTSNTAPAFLFYNLVETNKDSTTFTNIALSEGSEGTISLWFSPAWSGTNQSGSGPGTWANLINVGQYGTNGSSWWGWYLSGDGCTAYLASQSNGGSPAVYLSAPVSLVATNWYNFVVAYGPTNSAFYTNGVLVTNGTGVEYWPGPDATFFAIGSDTNGFFQGQGNFSLVQTYNYQLDPDTIQSFFGMYSIFYGLAGSEDADAKILTNAPPNPPLAPAPHWFSGLGDLQFVTNLTSGCATNSNLTIVWLTNFSAMPQTNGTVSVMFTIEGGASGSYYDVYGCTSFAAPATNTVWAWLGAGQTCTEYMLTNLPNTDVFLMLGTPIYAPDNDGLTLAFEALVSHTNPDSATYDGLPNAWIALNGLQGTNGLPGLDPDQDGLNNMQEYLYGTKPLVPEGITPWVGNPSGFSGLP